MFAVKYNGINSFLVGMAKILLDHGVERKTRGYICRELPGPAMIEITDPTSRLITIPERKWNLSLAYAESLWLASGRNDLGFIKYYLPRMKDFSDDNQYLRGGYGPRLRAYNGNCNDYKNNSINSKVKYENCEVDQFLYVINSFNRDTNTRQGVISIGDPPKDSFDIYGMLKETKDYPCTRLLQFMKCPVENKLNLTVYMRSNDFIWGAGGVNMFNFMFMQEYFASVLNLEIGSYYHIVNNLHYYQNRHHELVENLASLKTIDDQSYKYNTKFNTLNEFDSNIDRLSMWEQELRTNTDLSIIDFDDDFFNDWSRVFYHKITGNPVRFVNPLLDGILFPD